ncbi:AsmA family protein [Reyranella sp.]|uniref:AsmA family protein n=1 Tax=Reyranella sp. TaxID=1929291 RepID=UPI003D1346EF
MAFNRKRLLIGAAGFLSLVIAALLVLPSVIDTDAYKPEIAAQVKQATGRDIAIDGPIRLSLLPTPSVELDGVRFLNVPGSKNPNMVEVKSVNVTPSLLALLVGDIEVSEVALVEPKIALEIDVEGKPNWDFAPSMAAAGPGSSKPLSLDRFTVKNGTLLFNDSRTGLAMAAENADFSASVGSIDGPYSLAGSATVNGAPLKIGLAASTRTNSGYAIDATLEAGGGRLSYKGTLSELGLAARLSGRATASADNLLAFAETLLGIAGQSRIRLPPLLAGKFRFDGPVDLSSKAVIAKDFKLVLGEDSGSGSLALALTPSLAVEARFTAPRLDLDRWLAAIALPDQLAELPTAPPAASIGSPSAAAPPSGPGWLAALDARLSLEAGEVIYNRKPVRDVALELEARGGAVAVPRLTATLPGDLAVQARSTMGGNPARPTVSGDFSLIGTKLRETLAWLAIDVSSIPANKLTQLSVKGRLGSNRGNVQVTDAIFALDDLQGAGGIVVNFTMPLSIVTQVELGAFDLDSYMPPAGSTPAPEASAMASVTPILALLGPSIGLKLKVGRIDYRGDAITGVAIDVARDAGTLRMNEARVANLVGARVAIRGAVARYWTPQPRVDFTLDFEASDMDRVLKLAGGTPAGMGPLRLRGGVAGDWEGLTLRDCALDAVGWSVLANGVFALPGAGAKGGRITSASYKGSIAVNGQPIEAAIGADLSGSKPVISADLRTTTLDFGRLGGGSVARRPQSGVATLDSQTIGTPLRRVDGTLKVSVASLGGAPVPLGNAEIAATLKDGVLTVSRFEGGLYGGTINLAGVVDGREPSLSFEFKGEARDIEVGEVLRRSSGTNEIGSLIRIAIDGNLSADGVALRGNGTTVAEIRKSLAGGARLNGHIRARADRFLQILGSAATGVAGGVIDATLGNVMSVLGEKGGVGVGNLLNAISLVLNRFVNNDNALSGNVEIAGGVLTDRNLTLQGNGARATIATRTDLGNGTTDSTINFMLNEDPSAPYLIVTARGPLGAPSFNAVRGSASDPPGVTSIFQNLPHVPVPSLSIPVPHIPMPQLPNIFGR